MSQHNISLPVLCSCPSWKADNDNISFGHCSKGYHKGRPTLAMCNLLCKENPTPIPNFREILKNYNKINPPVQKSRGLGDTIEKITTATGIKAAVDKLSDLTGVDCGCEKRKNLLNNLIPYNTDHK